jgi:hypothetical protein
VTITIAEGTMTDQFNFKKAVESSNKNEGESAFYRKSKYFDKLEHVAMLCYMIVRIRCVRLPSAKKLTRLRDFWDEPVVPSRCIAQCHLQPFYKQA